MIIDYEQVKQSVLYVNNKSWKFMGKTFLKFFNSRIDQGKKAYIHVHTGN